MSPSSGSDVPSRPKFSFDLKNPPWTDSRGNQETYYRNVVSWKSLHDLLPENHASKITAELQGIILKSQLYGRAADLAEKVTIQQLKSANGALHIAKTIFKVDPLSSLTDGFSKFQSLLNTRRGQSESFRNFESRFDAAVCKFNSSSTEDKLSPSLISFLLLANANVEDNHRISILAAASPHEDHNERSSDSDFEIPKFSLSYETVATVIRSCDKTQPSRSHPVTTTPASFTPLSSHTAQTPKQLPRKRNAEEIKELKKKTRCKDCNEVGHWRNDPECMTSQKSSHAQNEK